MESRRIQRLEKMIHHELSQLLVRRIKDPRLTSVILTKVRLSNDFKHAHIYFINRGGVQEDIRPTMKSFTHAQGFFRSHLAAVLELRSTPELHFLHDDGFEESARVLETIDRLFPGVDAAADDSESQSEAGAEDTLLP